jgi:hypothetical protein
MRSPQPLPQPRDAPQPRAAPLPLAAQQPPLAGAVGMAQQVAACTGQPPARSALHPWVECVLEAAPHLASSRAVAVVLAACLAQAGVAADACGAPVRTRIQQLLAGMRARHAPRLAPNVRTRIVT